METGLENQSTGDETGPIHLATSSFTSSFGDEAKSFNNLMSDAGIEDDKKELKDRIIESIINARHEEDEDGHGERDICRVCRLSGKDTLYHPCLCTGSIKYVHQDCLLQWLKYSKKDVCELCNHKFSFRPLYRPDMPERLPIWELLKGVFLIMARFMRLALTYTLVASCWLGLVPLMAARIHRMVFSGLLSSFFSSRILQLFSAENVAVDIARGSLVVTLFLCTFISLVWLREQIMIGGPAHLLHLPNEPLPTADGGEADPDGQQQPPSPPARQQDPLQINDITEPRGSHDAETTSLFRSTEDQSTQTASEQYMEPSTSSAINNQPQAVPGTSNAGNLSSMDGVGEGEPNPSIPIDQKKNSETDSLLTIPQPSQRAAPSTSPPLQRFQPVQQALVAENNNNLEQDQQQVAQNGIAAVAAAAEIDPQQQRFVDELTWQRLLGLDGSFAFIEHVFWTISLNFVFNIVFLYFPSQLGSNILALCGFGAGRIVYFELPISILTGLVVILAHGLLIHRVAKIFRLKTLYTTAGMICLMLKVFLLVVVELIIFPILCGWWLDICSLPLTGVTLEERMRSFRQYPSSSMFLHWLAGMVYVFYSASFILILRELLRPGVLWFIRNLNDPDFNPIQEMIEQPVPRHLRRLVASMTLFFSIILLVVYVPLRSIKWVFPSTLPYVFSGSADTPLVEYSFELVLLQVIMPTILEYSKAFLLLKRAVRLWCRVVGGWLQLDSYLLPAEIRRNADHQQRDQQRQRARERLLRGDQEEQIGLLEALEAIEDDTTEDEGEEDNNEQDDEDYNEEGEDAVPRRRGRRHRRGGEQDNGEDEEEVQNVEENQQLAGEVPAVNGADDNAAVNNQELGVAQANDGQNNALGAIEEPEFEDDDLRDDQRLLAQFQLEQRNLGAQHQALLRFRDPTVSEDFVRPTLFPLRIAVLLVFVAITAVLISLVFFLVPVTIGRTLLSLLALTNQPVHDLYTIAVGLYTCWLCIRLGMLSREWAQKGWAYMKKVFNSAAWLILRVVAASFPLLVVIPFMLGLYFQLLVISPLRVTIFQSPLFFPWKEWAMGVVHFKILCASVLMGPDWWMKTAFEQIYADGIWNFRLRDLYVNLVLPIVNALAFLIALPYTFSKLLLIFIESSREEQVIVTRYAYPCMLGSVCICAFLIWQWQKLKLLAQKIRNDKYLIGTQLVNFYRENTPAPPVVAAPSSSATQPQASTVAREQPPTTSFAKEEQFGGTGAEMTIGKQQEGTEI